MLGNILYVKMLCITTTKPPSTSTFYVDFKKNVFQRSKKWTHLSIFKCFVPCQVDLWAETLPFSAVLPLEKTQTSAVAMFFHTHVLPHHSKAQLLRYCGKRSFLGVAKSWKTTLIRVPWFGRHVENLGDVIIYPVLVVARTEWGGNREGFLAPSPVSPRVSFWARRGRFNLLSTI